jgi:tRNA G37 N-methylase Trm5
MSVPYLREAAAANDVEKLVRFVRLHLGDGNENVGRKEIDRSWAEAIKSLLNDTPPNYEAIERVLQEDETTLALLYFHLHFYLVRKSGEWIHDGSR